VTIAGSLQSELGCPGDWQPECVQTQLAQGSDEVWRATFDVPGGSYEYKAALNGGWAENYGANGVADGPNIPLAPAGDTAVRFYYDHGTHWVTDSATSTIATAAGSFQSELGCDEDWQPQCLRSWLQDVDGDGTYSLSTAAIPPGAYELKVALNENWDVNYGDGGTPGGANVPFSVARAGDVVEFTWSPTDNVPTVTVEGQGSGPLPGDEDLVTDSLRTGLVGEQFYFVLPDRFANGDPTNDTAGVDPAEGRLVHGFDVTDKGFYHGGDLAGLQGKLDYLQGMGVTAIWMTPMFRNRWVQGVEPDISAGYHGYWTTDFTSIDPHFGTNAEMRDLIADAQSRGMKVFFDIITNHTADVIQYEEGQYTYRSKAAFPYVDANGNEFDDRDYAFDGSGPADFPPLDAGSFPYTPVVPPELKDVKVPDWLNDVTLYHNRGDSTFAGESSQYGDFFGLDDLFTEHPDVVDGMIDIFQFWVTELGIDGYRIDTVKHVNDEFWEAFAPAVLEYAQANGKPDFFFFGEVFDGNPAFTARYTTELPLPAVLDFPFQGAASTFAQGGSPGALRDLFLADDLYIDDDSNAYSLPTFLGNHDMGRIGWFLRNTPQDEWLGRSTLAHSLMMLARGNPVVYYGDEQGFTGDGGDKDARQDMFPSQVDSYNDDVLIGTDATTADDNFDPTHPIYQHVAALSDLTAAHPALRSGLQQHRLAGSGVYAFSRMDWDEGLEYVVVLNNSTAEQSAQVPTYSADLTFEALWPAGAGTAATDAQRRLPVTVPPLSAAVYRASAPVTDSASAPGITVSSPAVGDEVTGTLTFGAQVGGTDPAQVTFAVREAGTADWSVVGTDDNAPHSVPLDVSGYDAGTELELRAIVQTRSGELNADQIAVTVGKVVEPPPSNGGGAAAEYLVVHFEGDEDGLTLVPAGDVESTDPAPFVGDDAFGRFAWTKLTAGASEVTFEVRRGSDVLATTDSPVNPQLTPEVWVDDAGVVHPSLAHARGYATIHYNRPDGAYDGWGLHLWGDAIADGVGTEWENPRPPDGTDDFGPFWQVPLKDPQAPLNFIIHKGDEKDPGPDQSFIPASVGEVWVNSGDETLHRSLPAAEGYAEIHYHRPASDYGDYDSSDFNDFWGMHVWTGAAQPNPSWQEPVKPAAFDAFGPVFRVPLAEGATRLNFILHRGDAKDPDGDQSLDLAVYGNQAWYVSGQQKEGQIRWLLPIVGRGVDADLTKAQAHWVAADTVLWQAEGPETNAYSLRWSEDGDITAGASGITGGRTIRLAYDPDGMTDTLAAQRPHLAGYQVFKVRDSDLRFVPDALRGQVVAVERGADGALRRATSVQIPGVLDDLYADAAGEVSFEPQVRPNGRTTLRLWAPTAQDVRLLLYPNATAGTPSATVPMTRDDNSGVWSATGPWRNRYYRYAVTVWAPSTQDVVTNEVTDPYSLALATDSARSLAASIDTPATQPPGWAGTRKPSFPKTEAVSIYELHVRDFSIGDTSVPAAERGTYLAFTRQSSDGMQHLRRMAQAGVTHLHLLPVFDIATVPERRADQAEPPCDLPAITAAEGPASPAQQECVGQVRDTDGFNWGYDPWHYTAPEGSYATDPEGTTRTRQFRQMVQGINRAGLRVVMDVVYNHTTASGQDERSVLDRVVPGYYHRLDENGAVATSTCCANTATEHAMMEKLMVDSVVTWARDYKVDGFRFDLMGHHSKANMLKVRDALDRLTVRRDGVNGEKIILYGEGWNFGEVANDARFVQATQANMAGTGIGTFSDRLRDAVRGGGPFDGNPRVQGFGSGLATDPNGDPVNGDAAAQSARVRGYEDLVKLGLAANLKDFSFLSSVTGELVSGSQVDYNGSPAGYTADPQEVITYVDAHDNEALFDALAFKLPYDTTREDRTRMNVLSMATVALAQGPGFYHAGADLLRSKSLDRNSYNSGDWFNRIDWTGQETTFGSGLPPEQDNADKWPFATEALTQVDPPQAADMAAATARFSEFVQIGRSNRLFRLGTLERVQQRVSFATEDVDGLIVMLLDDTVGANLDPRSQGLAVVFNATAQEQTLDAPAPGRWRLHPTLASSVDPVVRTATADGGQVSVPARTVAVFERVTRR